MIHKVLTDIFTRHGNCKRDGETLHVPKASEACMFVALGTEPLIIERIARVDLEEELVVVVTGRREKYCVAYEDVRAVRFVDSESHAGY